MNRLTALLLTLIFAISLVSTACSHTTPPNDNATSSEFPPSSNTVITDPSATTSANNVTPPSPDEFTFTELIVVDNEDCLIKITGIDPDNMWGYTLKTHLENRSADKTYMFSIETAAINGVQCDPLFAVEVAADKKANEYICFLSDDDLKSNGVGEFTDIELTFRVYDSDDWSADDIITKTVHIYPYGEDKAVTFVRDAQTSDHIIIDNSSVTVIVTGYEMDEIWGYTANLFIINKTDKNLMFSADDVSVNGFMADPLFAESVYAGKCVFSSMSWMETTFEENSITEVEKIEFVLRVYDFDDWLADDLINETVTLLP